MLIQPRTFRRVNHAWDDEHASRLEPIALLVYRSRLLGSDGRITCSEDEWAEELRDKLAQFCANRTLLKRPITLADQAEAIFLGVTASLRQTTA
jgi:hypothetical protein